MTQPNDARGVDVTPPTRPHEIGSWRGRTNYVCPSCPYAGLDPAAFDRHSCRGEVRLAPGPLDSVAFASTRAAELANEHGLLAADFAGSAPSSESGFTTSDVRGIAAAQLQE